MENLNNLINKAQSQAQQNESEQELRLSEEREDLLAKVWEVLAQIYGSGLITQYGEEMPEAWAILLKGLSPKSIWGGLEALRARDSSFTPNGLEFANACKPLVGSIAHKEFVPAKALVDMGAKDRSDEARKKAIGEMFK